MSYSLGPVRLALVSGPAYDPLYDRLAGSGVPCEVAFLGDHPSLNRHLASFSGALPYDLVSTHSKYAPSQKAQLAPLDEHLPREFWSDFSPQVLDLVSVDGQRYGVPRNLDVRLLHYRTDLADAPTSWDDLLATSRLVQRAGKARSAFVFPGMESGLFGTFYELCAMAGGELFPASGAPSIESAAGEWALGYLRTMVAEGLAPREARGWHYDAVHAYFRAGNAAFAGDWPGYYAFYRDPALCPVSEQVAVAAYPVGPAGKSLAYGGGHTFALTLRGAASPEALRVLEFLTAPEQQALEAARGFVPVRRSVMAHLQAASAGRELERLRILEQVSSSQILVPPKFARYPELEETVWRNVQAAVFGDSDVRAALRAIRARMEQVLESA